MQQVRPTHVLFDFFGTLVEYSPSRVEQGFEKSYDLVLQLGADLSYADFLTRWSQLSAEFDKRSDQDDHEFSMIDVGTAFLVDVVGREPARADAEAFVAAYVGEWNKGVRYPDGIADLVKSLAGDYRLAVVTNTHEPALVPRHLQAMGVLPAFDAVITSVEVGWRKPHPTIYATTLARLGIDASAAVFVGDTYRPDFEGPESAGIRAFLIDPEHRTPVPEVRRIASVFELPARLRAPH